MVPGLALRDFRGRVIVKPLAPPAYRGIHSITRRRGEGCNPKIKAVQEQLARSGSRDAGEVDIGFPGRP
ncbi:hypothetical protein NXC14_CH02617 [Rhizobium sp. NXC14]|nr:hypothetical protein NXC14_CH02617 [Rhizobium sp. NXC14]